MTHTITLTREQYEAIWDGLDQLRDRHDHLYEVTSALITLGLHKPAALIDDVHEDAVAETIRLQGILVNADDAAPLPEKVWSVVNWLFSFRKSNREA